MSGARFGIALCSLGLLQEPVDNCVHPVRDSRVRRVRAEILEGTG